MKAPIFPILCLLIVPLLAGNAEAQSSRTTAGATLQAPPPPPPPPLASAPTPPLAMQTNVSNEALNRRIHSSLIVVRSQKSDKGYDPASQGTTRLISNYDSVNY